MQELSWRLVQVRGKGCWLGPQAPAFREAHARYPPPPKKKSAKRAGRRQGQIFFGLKNPTHGFCLSTPTPRKQPNCNLGGGSPAFLPRSPFQGSGIWGCYSWLLLHPTLPAKPWQKVKVLNRCC